MFDEKTTKISRDLEATQIINMTQNSPNLQVSISEDELKEKIIQPDWGNLKSCFSNLSVLGFGGMGTVFSAKDNLFYRNLALKIMRGDLRNNEESINLFLREARITAQIDHPNVVPVYNLGVFDGTGAYFSMKKVEGETLEYVLKKLSMNNEKYHRKYSLRRRLEIFINICNGVAFAHSKGVIHRDLKPANIMLGNYGEVFIMDWGMALYNEKNDLSSKGKKIDLREEFVEKKKNVIAGTPLFLSPEQICGCEVEFGEASDVYSLGNILYCLLCCSISVYDANIDTEVLLNKIVDGEFIPPRKRARQLKIPKELEAICLKALEVDRDYRYSSAKELLKDIRNYLDLQVVGVNNSPLMRFIKFCQRHPMIPSAVLAAILTVTLFFSYFYIADRLEFNSIIKIMDLNYSDCGSLLTQQRRFLTVRKKRNMGDFLDYAKEQTENNNAITINEAQFYDAATENLNALDKIASLTYYPDISKRKLDTVKIILDYYVLSTSKSNFKKVIERLRKEWRTEFYTITTQERELREKLRLLEAESGRLNLEIDGEYTMSVSYQDVDELGSENEKSVMVAPFNEILKEGTYIFSFKNDSYQTLSVPIRVIAGVETKYNLIVPYSIPEGMIYIPEGEYLSHIISRNDFGYSTSLDGFFIKQNEVTFGEYLEFWNSLDDRFLKEEFKAHNIENIRGLKLVPLWDDNGALISPLHSNLPVRGISLEAMKQYCKYMADKLGKNVRLPYFEELEKSARGVDQRLYVWGNIFDKEFALLNVNSNSDKYKNGAVAGTFEHDKSVYGVNDLAGNMREIVNFKDSLDYGVFGGSYLTDNMYASCSNVYRFTGNTNDIGFRYVIELDKDGK